MLQWNALSPSDGSLSPQSLSSQGDMSGDDQFSATNMARAVDPLYSLTPPPTLPLASGQGSQQQSLTQYDAQPDPYASFNHFSGTRPPEATASQQLAGGSSGTTPMPVSSTANSFNANITTFSVSSQSPEFYNDAHLFHLFHNVIPAHAGRITISHSARRTRDAQYTYWDLGATQDVASNINCFSSRGADGPINLPLDNASAGSLTPESPTALEGGLNFPPTTINSPTMRVRNFRANGHEQLLKNHSTPVTVAVELTASPSLAGGAGPLRHRPQHVKLGRAQHHRFENVDQLRSGKVTGKVGSKGGLVCPTCGFVSSRKKDVGRHMLNRHGVKGRHKCHECEKIYGRLDNLQRHQTAVHGRERTLGHCR